MKETKFKQTEIGEIPEDWEVTTLGNVVNVFDGTHQTPHYVDYGFAFYSVENVTADNFTHTKYISKEEYDFLTKSHKIEKNDVLMTRIGSIGVCKYVDWESKAAFYVSLALFKAKNPKSFCMKYLAFASNAKYFNDSVLLNSLQFAIPQKINLGEISKVMLALPPTVEEQERIAEALSDADGLLRELDGVIAKKRAIKQGAMQELLTGKRRLEGFTGEWEEKKLGKVIDVEKGEQVNGSQLSDSNNLFPMLNGGATFSGYYPFANQPANTITISEGGNSCGFVNYVSEPFWAGGHCYVVRPLIDVDLLFLYQILKYRELDIMKLRVGSGLPNIQRKTLLSDITLLFPTNTKEQTAIANILSDMDEEIAALEAKRAKYEQVKQGMMQELLTGRIRLIENQSESQENKKLL